MHDLQKNLLFFYVFNLFLEKYLVSFVVVPLFLSKKITLKKKSESLYFSLFCFFFFIYSLICVISSCLLSLLLVFSFSTLFPFFSLPFSFHVSLSLCLPLPMFIYSLTDSLSLSLLCFFCLFLQKNTFIDFLLKNLFICSSLLAKLFLFYLLCCFAPFFSFVFSIVFFRTREIDPFFFWQKNNLFNPSKNFSEILSFDVFWRISFIVFRFFLKSLSWKLFLNFVQKIPQNGICNQQCLSRSHFLIIFLCWERYPSLQLSKKNVFYHLLLVSLIVRESFLEKISFEKIVFLKKTKHLLSPLDFCSIFFFFWESKNSFLFFNCPFIFLRLCFSFFFFFCLFFLVSFLFFLNLSKQKSFFKKKTLSRTYSF